MQREKETQHIFQPQDNVVLNFISKNSISAIFTAL